MTSLYLRNLLFTILQPGIVAGLIPYLIEKEANIGAWGLAQFAGLLVALAGLAVMLACIFRFATEGQGTLSPADPTKKLVTGGLYQFCRNPMYVGVMGILIGEALFFSSPALRIYALLVFGAFNLFILFHEEPRLKRDFGEAYSNYCKRVGRWSIPINQLHFNN